MTARKTQEPLDCTGLWRDGAEGQRREVSVRLAGRTLVMADARAGAVHSHWSVDAVERRNPGADPAVFAPGPASDETLELTDSGMIAALSGLQSARKQARPHPGRLRALLIGGTTAAVLGLAALVLPDVLVTHTAGVVPPAKRAEIGQAALDDVVRLTGAPCDRPEGLGALSQLAERVFGPEGTPILYILPEGLDRPAHLPGGVILLPVSLIQTDAPDALAGAALAEGVAALRDDPMLSVLRHAGLMATLELLTSGTLSPAALRGYGEKVLRGAPAAVPDSALIESFKTAQVPLEPYARWRDPSGASTAALISGDAFKGLIPSPLLPDDAWIALQSVCSG